MGQGVYRIADHVTCRSTNTELRMLFDRKRGVMYELNETASSVVGLLEDTPRDPDNLVAALLDEYDAPIDEIRADVMQILSDFVQAGLIIEAPAGGESEQ